MTGFRFPIGLRQTRGWAQEAPAHGGGSGAVRRDRRTVCEVSR